MDDNTKLFKQFRNLITEARRESNTRYDKILARIDEWEVKASKERIATPRIVEEKDIPTIPGPASDAPCSVCRLDPSELEPEEKEKKKE